MSVPTLIARFGSKGDQYKSGVAFIPYDNEIWAAAVLAEAAGHGPYIKNHHLIVIDNEVIEQSGW